MQEIDQFELPKWVESRTQTSSLILAGSATPPVSIQDLIDLSTDKEKTADRLSINSLKLSMRPPNRSETLCRQIAGLYSEGITADQVLPTVGTTGANSLVLQSLLAPGDHVIAMYPSYTQLLSIPRAIPGVELSFWMLDVDNGMQADVQLLESLIKPTTKMIILNNPNNPLGTALSPEVQSEIAALARSHGLILFVDEIFRPLFHDPAIGTPPSFIDIAEHNDKIVVTSSMSKAWGLSGVRVGWIVTRNPEMLARCVNLSLYTSHAVSTIDQVVATEALSDRCLPKILAMHLDLVRAAVTLLRDFVHQHQQTCSWIRPNAGATAFVRFSANGVPVDDVDFCQKLKEQKGVLLAPGSLCFGMRGVDDFRGFARVQLTVQPSVMRSALEAIGDFLASYATPE